MWCWCGSVLMALLPATSPNSAFLLPLLQVVGISIQPRRAYYKFPEPEPRSPGGFAVAGPSLWNSLPAALRRPQMTLHTFKRQLKSTSDVLLNRRNISPPPGAVVHDVFMTLAPNTKLKTYLLTYLFTYLLIHTRREINAAEN